MPAMTAVQRTSVESSQPTLLQRIAKKDKAAVTGCIHQYGRFIWALARKFTASHEEAEAATQEIFMDIWQYAQRTDVLAPPDDHLVSLIARRRLFKYRL